MIAPANLAPLSFMLFRGERFEQEKNFAHERLWCSCCRGPVLAGEAVNVVTGRPYCTTPGASSFFRFCAECIKTLEKARHTPEGTPHPIARTRAVAEKSRNPRMARACSCCERTRGERIEFRDVDERALICVVCTECVVELGEALGAS